MIATRDFPVTSVDNILKWPNAEPPYFGRLRGDNGVPSANINVA
jgi:hypothetical protein